MSDDAPTTRGHEPVRPASHVIVPPRTYLIIFGALMALTLVTTAVAYVDLGPLNPVIALTIASFKALLVVLYFMHVRYGTRLVWCAAAIGFYWLHIILALTLADYLTRGWLAPMDW
ncbi:MAG TPA: cytochrome C oxidase subunit IV family protein [Candidatus Polarisedimenticolia bacterium]|nr:cytochrome C oxidase subunit IV family protein [Candidatus Polarisedimenticolia bacterium]